MYVHRTNNGKRISQYTCSQYTKVPVSYTHLVLAKLSQFKEMVKNAVVDRTKRKELER